MRTLKPFTYEPQLSGKAIWVEVSSGLNLETLDGQILDHLPGALSAFNVSESSSGQVRVAGPFNSSDGWFLFAKGASPRALPNGRWFRVSPDGRYISYLAPAQVTDTDDLTLFEVPTGKTEVVARSVRRCQCDGLPGPVWSDDGRYLIHVYLSSSPAIVFDMSMRALDFSGTAELARFDTRIHYDRTRQPWMVVITDPTSNSEIGRWPVDYRPHYSYEGEWPIFSGPMWLIPQDQPGFCSGILAVRNSGVGSSQCITGGIRDAITGCAHASRRARLHLRIGLAGRHVERVSGASGRIVAR